MSSSEIVWTDATFCGTYSEPLQGVLPKAHGCGLVLSKGVIRTNGAYWSAKTSATDFTTHFVFVELSDVLYNFLPGSGNNNHSFPIAANEVGLIRFWPAGTSKKPAILKLIEDTHRSERKSFCPLMLAIVRHAVPWRRSKENPLTKVEVRQLNEALRKLEIKIPELHRSEFLSALAEQKQSGPITTQPESLDHLQLGNLHDQLLALTALQPVPRGFAFERFLREMFAAYKLDPRKSFRLEGEQIDGSFELDSHTYLVEAKWQNELIGVQALRSFSSTVASKSVWSRGLYMSYTGFSPDGLVAFGRGQPTPIICMDGFDLSQIIQGRRSFTEIIRAKARRAAETGNPFVRVADL